MSVPTISSLVRSAAKSEAEFTQSVLTIFEEKDHERIHEFFDKLNIPRSVEGEAFNEPLPVLLAGVEYVTGYHEEHLINQGVQKYMDRHEKKLKWHAQRPSMEGARNVLLLMREAMSVTELRLTRLQNLMRTKDELTPAEWAIARELMNRAYLSFRNFLNQVGGHWIDAMLATSDRSELEEMIGNYYELIDATIRKLEEHRFKLEERRAELTVVPEGFDPVKPPNYFGGDLLGRGPWKQFWLLIEARSHHFREALA